MEKETAIFTRELTRIFERGGEKIRALDNVNIEVPEGIIYGLLGPNGAGKTTLIRILATLLLPSSGFAYVGGYDVVREPDKVRSVINLVSGGERAGYGILTVKENLWFYSQLYGLGIREGWEKIEQLAELLDMKDFLNVRLNRISTGMAQKYSLARGLLNDPDILFLDEPTLGLDVGAARAIRKIIKAWVHQNQNKTILLTTHYMAEAEELCDLISIIHEGRIIATGSPTELKHRVSKEVIYKIEVKNISEEDMGGLKKEEAGIVGLSTSYDAYSNVLSIRLVMDTSDVSHIIRYIEKLNGRIISISKVEPTLEDVFLKLVGVGLSEY
jgi:ABC-2 type transport system ATP-binding protein